MISVRFGTPAYRALALLVARPGQLDAAALGQSLWRPQITSTADYLQARRAMLAHGFAAPRTALRAPSPLPQAAQLGASWSAEAAKLLHGLQRRGMVERVRPPQVAEEWLELLAADGPAAVIRAGADPDAHGPSDPTGLRAHLLAELVRATPATVTAWAGAGPSGNVVRAIADLVEWGIVVPPSFRWPTPQGIDWIAQETE